MRRTFSVHLTLAVLAILAGAALAPAQVGTTGFDVDLSGNTISAGQRLTYEFGAVGITFSAVGADDDCDAVYANDNQPSGFGSPPNVVSLCPPPLASDIAENGIGMISARFATPVRAACIDVRPDGVDDFAVMRAYDNGNQLVAEAVSLAGVTQTLCVEGERIRRVEFSGAGVRYCRFDNFAVDIGSVGSDVVRYLPGAANLPGYGGTRWRTDLEMTNPNPGSVTCRIDLLERGQANPDPEWVVMTVTAGETVRFADVLESVFGFEGAGALKVTATGGSLIVNARTYNDDPAGTYGQFVVGVAEHQAVTPGREGVLNFLRQSPDSTVGYRTNLGLTNLTDREVRVEISLFDGVGNLVVTTPDLLQPFETAQIDRVLQVLSGGGLTHGYIIVSSSTPEAVFHAYASVVDNRSGDGTFVSAVVR